MTDGSTTDDREGRAAVGEDGGRRTTGGDDGDRRAAAGDDAEGRSAVGEDPAERAPAVDVDRYAIEPDCTREEFLAVVRVYARAVVDRHDLSVHVSGLDWEVSVRAKRRAGAVRHRDGDPQAVVLTWEQFAERGWSATAATVRHELIHVHLLNEDDDPGHGPAFRRLAGELGTSVHCDRFAEPEWWVECTDCGTRIARYRESKLVTHTEQYACGECGGDLRSRPND